MNFFHREGPAAQGMARRLAIKKAPWKNAANQLGCVIFYGGMVGPAGFEPTDGGVKVLGLTAWRRPIIKRKDRAGTGLNGLWWGA